MYNQCRYIYLKNRGLLMKIYIKKWGNSLALRIPKSLADEINLKIDTPVTVSVDKNKHKILITRINEEQYSLESMLTKVSEENIHKEYESGKPVGKEIW